MATPADVKVDFRLKFKISTVLVLYYVKHKAANHVGSVSASFFAGLTWFAGVWVGATA